MSEYVPQTWDQWLDSVDTATRSRAESLRDTFARLGADRPETWAGSEVREDFAQLGRFVFLRAVWREIERWRDRDAVVALCEEASEEARDVAARLAAQAAFDVALGIVQLLDNEEDIGSSEPVPGWMLIECDAEGRSTGRALAALHESILECDPRHIEAEDIRGW